MSPSLLPSSWRALLSRRAPILEVADTSGVANSMAPTEALEIIRRGAMTFIVERMRVLVQCSAGGGCYVLQMLIL